MFYCNRLLFLQRSPVSEDIPLLFSSLAIYVYFSADTKARPIIGKAKRQKLKIKSVAACVFLLLMALMLQNEAFYVLNFRTCCCSRINEGRCNLNTFSLDNRF